MQPQPPYISPYAESLLVHFRRAECLKEESLDYPSLDLNTRQLCDLELLLNRAFYPLDGFMRREDYQRVLEEMRLADGTVWPVPVCLDLPGSLARELEVGGCLALRDQEGFMLAVMRLEDLWQPDKKLEARHVFGTDDPERHPGVRTLLSQTGEWYAGGRLEGVHLPLHFDFPELRLTPSDTHRRFSQSGWRSVIGFQTERPLHCAHKEMVLRAARSAGASIFLHPTVGIPAPGDLDHFTMVRCYQEFVKLFPKNMISMGLLPMACRKAGPREALWQAIVRRNFGCSHFMVAPDHADPFAGNGQDQLFYPRGAAQELVGDMAGETGIAMVPLQRMVYVEERAQYLAEEEVGEGMQVREISSAELKRRLEHGLDIPEWFSFPEVVAELRKAHPPRHRQGFTVFISGLSGAGKSTLAKVLYMKFLEMRERPVTLLDGDIVRKYLSSELGFSREHRELNITRIGFVASEITKNRGIALCAPIAPYEGSRLANRELISRYGGYVEVYMSTPLEVCEQRDRKGLYAKARKGIIKGVTGIDDPYIPPSGAELVIDTTTATPFEAAQQVLLYLEEQGYIR
ncbi:MAG: bifunctional sulfate adenylyltransferase/adenylylsulfate kinase [Desulfohalobiaceae bacterium]